MSARGDARVEIEVGPSGFGSVVVDGVNLSNYVAGFDIKIQAGETTQVALLLKPMKLHFVANPAALSMIDRFKEKAR